MDPGKTAMQREQSYSASDFDATSTFFCVGQNFFFAWMTLKPTVIRCEDFVGLNLEKCVEQGVDE
jgi:hypothetical protein